MPSQPATSDLLLKIANMIRNGSIKTLRIRDRVKGKNKGVLFIDYTVQPECEAESNYMQYYRQNVSNILVGAARSMLEEDRFRLQMTKSENVSHEHYQYIYEVMGERVVDVAK